MPVSTTPIKRLLREEASGVPPVPPAAGPFPLLPALRLAVWALCALATLAALSALGDPGRLPWEAPRSAGQQAAVAAEAAARVVGYYVLARATAAVLDVVAGWRR
jgi:hypothetical protein